MPLKSDGSGAFTSVRAGYFDGTAVDALWVADHLLQADPAIQPDEPMLEAYTGAARLATSASTTSW